MTHTWTRRLGIAAAAVAAAAAFATPADAQPIVGLTTTNSLITFDSATPGTVSAPVPVTGLTAGDSLIAIDRDPRDAQLYALGSQSRIYKVSAGGAATQVGPVLPTPLTSANADIDFDTFGFLRIVTDSDQNIVWSPDSTDEFVQTPLDWTAGDPFAAFDEQILGLAYSNNVQFGSPSTAYVYDYKKDVFATLGSVNGSPDSASSGQLKTIGLSGAATIGSRVSLDSAPDGTMFALLRTTADGTRLYTVDPATGHATAVGAIGAGGDTTVDIATDAVTNNFKLGAASYSVDESGVKVTLTVTRNQSRGSASVAVQTTDASATAGTDYTAASASLGFSDGQTSRTLDIKIHPDAFAEPTETFTAMLSQPTGGKAAIVAPTTTVVQIADDDTTPIPSTPVTVLTQSNQLETFDTATPGNVSAPLAVTGLPAGEELIGIDRRPATGQLYALGKQNRLYTLDESSGAATQVGSGTFLPTLNGSAWGFDFDPVTDRVRVTANGNGQSLRLNPDDGTAVTDSPLVFNGGQLFSGTPNLPATAYSNNVPGATNTTLYAYDYQHDYLVLVGSPGGDPVSANSGATALIGPSGITAQGSANAGLDIGPDGIAWGLLRDSALTRIQLVDLRTGIVSTAGEIGAGADVYRDIATPAVSNAIQIDGTSVAATEGDGNASVKIVRSQSLGVATIDYSTANGSASSGADYTATSGTLTFAAGETSKTISIPVADDSAVEGPETLGLTIANPRGGVASLGSAKAATVTIADNDKAGSQNPPPVDPKARVTLCGKTKQDLVKQKYVSICLTSNEAATADVTGKVTVKGVKKPFTLTSLKGQKLKAVKALTVKVKLSRKVVAAVKKGKKATATIAIAVKDGGGNVTKTTRKVSFSRTK